MIDVQRKFVGPNPKHENFMIDSKETSRDLKELFSFDQPMRQTLS